MVCLRSPSIGVDTAGGYFKYFQYIQAGSDLSWVEPAWIYINKICIWIGAGYQGVLALSGILSLIPVYYVIKKSCSNSCFALAVYYGMYFVLFSFNLVRQNIAISFAFLAMFFFVNKKMYNALLFFCLGFLFHNSVLVVLVLIFFLKINMSFAKTILLLAGSFFAGLLLSDDFFFVVSGEYSRDLLDSGGYAGFRNSIFLPATFALLLNIFIIAILLPQFDKIKNNPWYLITLMGLIVMNLTVRLGQGTRVVLYFSIAQVIFIPNYIKSIEQRNEKCLTTVLYVAYLGMNFCRILFQTWDDVCPYTFFWQ